MDGIADALKLPNDDAFSAAIGSLVRHGKIRGDFSGFYKAIRCKKPRKPKGT
jgi:hypothetical protein